jgi:hypothetical protein
VHLVGFHCKKVSTSVLAHFIISALHRIEMFNLLMSADVSVKQNSSNIHFE